MINKRLLVKALLSHNDENSFYDKKLKLNLSTKEGKAKFLKHICALSNSNPNNDSFIVIGVEDQENTIVGVDFFDDSKLQNLINAYLKEPPLVVYENIPFPHLPKGKVVGLVTIRPLQAITVLKKNSWKYLAGTTFFREGSISTPKSENVNTINTNQKKVATLLKHAQNNIGLTLDGVIDFIQTHHSELTTHYKVFKETFVLCWSGIPKKIKETTYYSRVDIELINEQVKLFYSNLDEVKISFTEDVFTLTEYVKLSFNNLPKYYPLEKVSIIFNENGSYSIDTLLLFEPPQMNKRDLMHFYNANNALLQKLEKKQSLSLEEESDLFHLSSCYMICVLNDFPHALTQLQKAKPYLKQREEALYETYKDCQRILRKVKYN